MNLNEKRIREKETDSTKNNKRFFYPNNLTTKQTLKKTKENKCMCLVIFIRKILF